MKMSEKIISTLNGLLALEWVAIRQYLTHRAYVENSGYNKLGEELHTRYREERHHARDLMARIAFLDGDINLGDEKLIPSASDIPAMIQTELDLENQAVVAYEAAIQVARDEKDSGTRKLLEDILIDEEDHVLELESDLQQIDAEGLENWLSTQR